MPKNGDARSAPSTPTRKPAAKASPPANKAGNDGGRGKKRKVEESPSDDGHRASDVKLQDENDDGLEMIGTRCVRARSTTVKAEAAPEQQAEDED